jgi:prefoldin subunit 5
MIFSTEQLTWIVVGACTLGGTGYMTVTAAINDLDKNIVVVNHTLTNTNQKIELLQVQLTRLEEKLDQQNKK